MAYYDPYAIQDPYGGYDPYGFDQTLEDTPPPEPSKDWVDVPKRNRSYLRKIPRDLIKDDFIHLKTEQFYGVEAMVENVYLNEDLIPEANEKLRNEIAINLKIMNLPELELDLFHSRSRIDEKLHSKITDQSTTSLPIAYPTLAELFQTLLSYSAGIAEEVEEEPEVYEEQEGNDEEVEETEQTDQERKATVDEKQSEPLEEEKRKLVKIDVMEGNNVLLLSTGMAMMQKLQTQSVRVSVGQNKITEVEDGLVSETVPLGVATIRFPKKFHKAVLRRESIKGPFSMPLIGEDEEEVGKVEMIVSLLSLGQGVEVEISEGPTFYRNVKLIDTFPPERVESIYDPVVHPRLALTLLNMEPPLGLCRTSAEIIQACLESKMVPLEGDEGTLSSRYSPKRCRWLEIAKEFSLRSSKLSLVNGCDRSLSKKSTVENVSDLPWPLSMLRCPRKEVDPEIDKLWAKLKLQCKDLWEEADEIENKNKALFEELDELLRQDKGEGWESESVSEKSKSSAGSKSSKHSGRKSTLKSTIQND